MNQRKKRVAIIGAGPAGLSCLRAFKALENIGDIIPEIICFEKQSDWGGQWNMTWRTGLDEHGEPVHSSQYQHMWTNAPKECYEYPGYTYDEHFGRPVPSYLERELFRGYFLAYAEKCGVRPFIQFNTAVRRVEYDDHGAQHFKVQVQELSSGKEQTYHFDYVIVATGHFSYPNMPYYEGLEQFPGRIIHSHDFRNPEEFTGQQILIIGAHHSASDIGLSCHKFGAKSVTISYRTKPLNFKWPETMKEVPLLTGIKGKTITFLDGSQRDVDSIIFCTGYKHHFPFMAENLRLITDNRFYPGQLYKGIFFQERPNLMYIGMQDLSLSTTLFDGQAWYARDVILGRIHLPDAEERAKDAKDWQAKESLAVQTEDLMRLVAFQVDYFKDLSSATDYPSFHLEGIVEMFQEWWSNLNDNIYSYRDKTHRSLITGTMAEAYPTPWIQADLENLDERS